MPTLLSQYVGLGESETAIIMAASTFSSMMGYIFCGWLSQKIGRIRAIGVFSLASLILALPLLVGLFHASSTAERAVYSSVLIMVATSGFGPIPAFLSERFPTAIRNTASGFVFNGGLIVGAWAPLLAVEAASGSAALEPVLFAANLMAGCLLTITGLRLNPETRNVDLRTGSADSWSAGILEPDVEVSGLVSLGWLADVITADLHSGVSRSGMHVCIALIYLPLA